MNNNYTTEKIIIDYKDKELMDIVVELGSKMK
jgi:hypothetical protein